MKQLLALALIAAAAAGCGGARSLPSESRASNSSTRVLDWGDLEPLSGSVVAVEGTFNHIRTEHGRITLDSGLDVYIPNLDRQLRGQPWLAYVGKRVAASGMLRTEACEIPGYNGPSLTTVESFAVTGR